MKKSDLLTSLEVSRELREAGAMQKSAHTWVLNKKETASYTLQDHSMDFYQLMYSDDKISAYTAEDIMHYLPYQSKEGEILTVRKLTAGYQMFYQHPFTGIIKHSYANESLVDGLAALWLFILKIKAKKK